MPSDANQPANSCNSSSMGAWYLWPLWARVHVCTCALMLTHRHTQLKVIKKNCKDGGRKFDKGPGKRQTFFSCFWKFLCGQVQVSLTSIGGEKWERGRKSPQTIWEGTERGACNTKLMVWKFHVPSPPCLPRIQSTSLAANSVSQPQPTWHGLKNQDKAQHLVQATSLGSLQEGGGSGAEF